MPCASVSAKRTGSRSRSGSPPRATTIAGGERRASRRADPGAPAVRRPDRRGRLDRERDPRLPLADGHLGAVRPDGVRDDRRVPPRPGEGLGLLRAAARRARRTRSRTPAHLALAELERRGLRRGGRHAERRPAPPGGRVAATWSRCTARSAPACCLACGAPSSRSTASLAARASPVPACPSAAAAVLKPDVVMFGELLPAEAIEAGLRARPRARACCSSSARRSRSTRSRGFPRTPCRRAGGSRS